MPIHTYTRLIILKSESISLLSAIYVGLKLSKTNSEMLFDCKMCVYICVNILLLQYYNVGLFELPITYSLKHTT